MLTIFTPTYNRAYCLKKLYDSLVNQECKDFTWLIVDDGSTDTTSLLVKSFIDEGIIKINYIYQQNSGKHVAINTALDKCNTNLFTCVDSDDSLTPDAVRIIIDTFKKYENEEILGVYFRQVHEDGSDCASSYPPNIELIGITDLYHDYSFSGETMIVLKRKLIGNIRFPVFQGEKFVTERVFYNSLNSIAPMVLSNKRIYISEYLPDGYTRNANRLILSNPYGSAYAFLNESVFCSKFISKCKNYAQYIAIMKIFNLSKKVFKGCKMPQVFVQICALILSVHYIRLYRNMIHNLK